MQLSKNSKIFLAGHNGMVGSSILRYLKKRDYRKIIVRNRKQLDLLNQEKTEKFFKKINISYLVFESSNV